jgi:hypothetical protein
MKMNVKNYAMKMINVNLVVSLRMIKEVVFYHLKISNQLKKDLLLILHNLILL